MDQAELKRLVQGPLAAVPTAFRDDYALDLDAMARLTEWWIDQGLVTGRSVIKVTAAMGEGPDLADDEWPQVLRTVVEAAKGRTAVVCGLKTSGTYRTVEDAKRAQDLGATAVQIDLPFLHHPTQDDYVRYFMDVSNAIDIGILIYNTWWFGCPSISPATMLRLADAERAVAIKWSVPPGGPDSYDDMVQFADRFNVIDNSLQWVRCHKNGGRGHISITTHAWPQQQLAVWDLLEAGKYDEAQSEYDRVETSIRRVFAKTSARSGGYQGTKAMLELMGLRVGPSRPPSLPLTADELAELKATMAACGWPLVAASPLRA